MIIDYRKFACFLYFRNAKRENGEEIRNWAVEIVKGAAEIEIVEVEIGGTEIEVGATMTIQTWFPSEEAEAGMIDLQGMILGTTDPRGMTEDVTIANHQRMIARRTITVMMMDRNIKGTTKTMMGMIVNLREIIKNLVMIVMKTMTIGTGNIKSRTSHADPEVTMMMTEARAKRKRETGQGLDPAQDLSVGTVPGPRSEIDPKIGPGKVIVQKIVIDQGPMEQLKKSWRRARFPTGAGGIGTLKGLQLEAPLHHLCAHHPSVPRPHQGVVGDMITGTE